MPLHGRGLGEISYFPAESQAQHSGSRRRKTSAAKMKLMVGVELNVWQVEAGQRALAEELEYNGNLPHELSAKSLKRFLARFKSGCTPR